MRKENIIIGLFISIFIINYTVRQIICSAIGLNIYYNLILLIFSVFIIKDKRFKKDKKKLIVIFFVFMNIVFTNLINRLSIGYYINPILNFIIPMIFISIDTLIDSKETFVKLMKIMNLLMYVVTFLGVIDYISGYKLNYLLRSMVYHSDLKELMSIMSSYGTYRLFNALGHPLVNVEYYLVYFFMNWSASKYLNINVNMLKVLIIYMIGLFLCGSKMGLILSLLVIFIYSARNNNKYLKVAILYLAISISIVFVNTPIFKENIGSRIVSAIESGDFTNGRLGSIQKVMEYSEYRPNILTGGGYTYSTLVTEKIKTNNFEFPPLMMAYDYGIIATLLIYCMSFIGPIIKLIKTKNILLSGALIVLVIYFNSFNGLVYGDSFARLAFIIKILYDISKLKNSDGSIQYENQ